MTRLQPTALLLPLLLGLGCAQRGATVAPNPPTTLASTDEPARAPVTDAVIDSAPATAPASIVALEEAFEGAASTIAPSVVSITSVRETKRDLPPFLRPFADPDGVAAGLGSGVIVDGHGHILTNNHVVAEADSLRVKLWDDRELTAEVVGTDPKTDLAVIRISDPDLVPATLASSDSLRVGQWVMAVGSPFGLPKTVTAGIISAVGRGSMGIADYGDFIQTDAAVNQGNSGGPLIDLQGRVVGINTAIASRDGGSNGIGFSIPIDIAHAVMGKLITSGVVERGWLGVVMGDVTPDLAASFDYAGADGVLIDDLDPDGPAAKAGLRVGDIVSELDGKPVRDGAEFRNRVSQAGPGTKVHLSLWRSGTSDSATVVLAKLPQRLGGRTGASRRPKKKSAAKGPAPLGLVFADLEPRLRARVGVDSGGALVGKVASGSVGATASLRAGDVIVSVAGTWVRDAQHAASMCQDADLDRGVRVRVQRGGFGRFVMLKRRARAR